MRIDGMQLTEGSTISNMSVATGTSFPSSPNSGELFFRTDGLNVGLYVNDGSTWNKCFTEADPVTLPANTTPGTYKSVAVNSQGIVTAGTNPTTLAGYGIADAQALDADLTAIAALAGTSGLLKKTAADTWTLDTNTYITGNQTITLSGGVTGSGTGSITATVVTNADLTGPITSTGNATSVASQTGTGSTFVMSAGPTLTGTLSTAAITASGLVTANAGMSVPTGQVLSIADQPATGTSAANKNYVDSIAAGLTWKNSVKAATTTAITLSAPQTVDGVSLIAGDRVLVKNQASAATNGIYVVAAGAWGRATDMDSSTPINEFNGAGVLVVGGSTQANTSWTVSSTIDTVGTDAVNWAQFSGASVVAAGAGITLTGNTVSLTNSTAVGNLSGTNTGDQTITLTGDVTGSGTGSFAATLATVNSNVGSFGSSSNIPVLTVNAKGQVTAISNTAVSIPSGSISVTGGDLTLSGNTGTAITNATLATVTQGAVGTSFVKVALDTKGRVTNNLAVAQADITGLLGAGSITNTMLANGAVANLSGTNTGDQTSVTGNAGTATALQTARTIAGTSFDGTANIGITYSNLTGLPTLGTAAAKNIPATGDASATEVVYGTDTRLTNARAANGGNATTVTNGVYTTDTGTVTNTMLAGSIANAKLLNSSVTVGSTNIALGATSTTLAGLTSVTSTSFVGALTGNASTVTTNANLTGEVTSVGNAATLTNSAVIGKVLTGYVSGAGTVAATDTILQAIQKLNGNIGAAPGTVTSVSVTSANGFAGSVATATSTPAITISTSVTGLLKGNGTAVSAAVQADVTGLLGTGSITNTMLVNNSLTVGSTNIALGATSTTLAGLSSVTSTSFVGALTGNASTATSATTAGTVTTAAQPAITSVGTLSSLAVTGDASSGSVTTNGVTINSGNIYRAGGTAPAYYMSQDGTGRQHWYWNTAGGTSPTFSVAAEDATDIMMTVNNSGAGGSFYFRTADGVGKSAGQALSWTNAMAVSTVAATFTGAVTGSNLSGTNTGDETTATIKSKLGITTLSGSNTGDQTITLTGGVTGSGTGSFAATVVTNANLTGPITSVGNATSIASQTGTGTTFVMSAGPTLTGTTSTAALTSSGLITANAGITVPTGQVITIIDQPSAGTSAANKNYVDAVAAGLAWKNSVKAATTAAITLSAPQTIDGISVIAGDRVLVKNQAAASANGIYVVAAGAWTRATDMDSSTPINEFNGAGVHVVSGTTLGNTSWTVSSTIVTVGTDAVNWAQFSGAAVVAAGSGITLSGNTISLTNSSLTIGSTNIALGATSTTLAGLTSVTSTTFVGALTGNASTATSAATLTTARNINGVSFNGSADITVTAAAGTLSGATLAAGVTASSLTSVGTLSSLAVNAASIATTTTAVTTTSATVVESFASASFRSAKYMVQIHDSTNSQYHAVEILVIHDNTTVYKTEYGEITSAASLGTFDAAIVTGNLQLSFTATAATTKSVKVYRTAITV